MRCQEKVSDCTWKPRHKSKPTQSFYAFTCPYCPNPGAHIFTNTCREDYKDKQNPRAFIKVVCTENNENNMFRAGEGTCTRYKDKVQHCKWTPQQLCNLVHHNEIFTCYAHASCAKLNPQRCGVCKQQMDKHTTLHSKEHIKCKVCRERFNMNTDPPCVTWTSTTSRGKPQPR